MNASLVFIDTETTGLALADDIWEFAAIRRDPDGAETPLHLFIDHDRTKCAQLPESFRVDHYDRYLDHRAVTRRDAAHQIADLFNSATGSGKPHVVGAVPNFDTERVAHLVAEARYANLWRYHLIDVENLAVGYLGSVHHRWRKDIAELNLGELPEHIAPPWDSDWLSNAVGVDPEQFDRHTAMGDVRWAMAIYDAVMGVSQ
jgi:hypothetical protein